MKNNKKIVITFLILCVALFFFDYVIGLGLKKMYFKQSQGKLYNLTYALEQQSADIIVMGSSRAMHHYNPKIISDSLMSSCYNMGYDGQSILYHKALLDVIIERYIPEIIILDVNVYELSKNQSAYDLLSVLNPYVERHPVLWNTLNLQSSFERWKHLSHIYPYNSIFARIIMGNMRFKTKDVSSNGFTARSGIWNDNMNVIKYDENEDLDKNKIEVFEQFLTKCKDNDIKIHVVLSPSFGIAQNNSSSIDYMRKICEKENIPFISYQNNSEFTDNKLFCDPSHLNDTGADEFSSNLSHLLKIRCK
jgi:hypothetical protein